MRKLLMATSALLLFGGSIGMAQDTVNPGTGEFEPSDQSDSPTPGFVDPNAADTGTTGAVDITAGLDADARALIAQNDCVRVVPGVGEFEPSNQSDEPTPGFVETECPEGWMTRAAADEAGYTYDTAEGQRINPGTGQFEPANQSDEPVPDVVEPDVVD